MFDFTVTQFIKMLSNAGTFLDRAEKHAETKKYDPQVLLQMRLAPDQYPLVKQFQIACDHAKFCAARLSGQEPPKHEDNEVTLGDVRNRIQKVISYLQTFNAEDFQGSEAKRIHVPYMPGKYVFGTEYAGQMALPNFYFHLTTAYSILRHAGVDLGKADFIGEIAFKS